MAYFTTKKKRSDDREVIARLAVLLCLLAFSSLVRAEWINHGNGLLNRRNAENEMRINKRTVSRLSLRWTFFAGNDISATPAVADGVVYFPSWNGYLYAVKAVDGGLIWRQNLSQLTGLTGTGTFFNITVSRSTPTVTRDLLIVGIYGPAIVIAVTRSHGTLVWSTQLDQRSLTQITLSGTVYKGGYYVGVSSLENTLPVSQCCTFRGSLVRLDVRTGRIQWRTYTLPDNGGRLGGYAGASIWGSSPSIDVRRRHVYVGTGNLYIAPTEVLECQERRNNQTNSSQSDQCFSSDAHFDSILAFDIDSGRIVWSRQLGGYDVFLAGCPPSQPGCPPGPDLDADFGEAPMLLTIYPSGATRRGLDVVVAVQKSGFAWALDRENGSVVWFTLAGPGGRLGGGTWGAATDGKMVYTNIANSEGKVFRLSPSNQTTTAGGWVGMDANSGQIIWTTANPSNDTAIGPVSLANGVLFAGSAAPNGPIYAMDGDTGRILWSNNTGATVYGGVSVSYGCIFLGNGYATVGSVYNIGWTGGTLLYAFCLPDVHPPMV